ncbi:MAG: DUF624 domain-containing protein [Thermomicrobiales bacterium]
MKLVWRGFRDLFDQLLTFGLYSVLWWVCTILIVPGPPATVALFAMCDPRRKVSQPDFSDAIQIFKGAFRRSWGIAIFTVPLIAILLWNLLFFSGSNHPLIALVPLWLIMILLVYILTLYAFSVAATMESGTRNALRGALFVLVSRPFFGIGLGVFMLILGSILAVTVLPMILFGPALMACIVNRFALVALDVPVIDPDAPTDERQDERERGINPDRGLVGRMRGGNARRR